jgi:DNA primase
LLSSTTIEHVRELPIEQIINTYVTLKRSGSRWVACCPLHGEKTPSFTVTPVKNSFHCYGCGVGGDAIAFVMAHDNLPFIEAVKSIANAHGVEVVESDKGGKTPEQKADETIMYELVQAAQKKYRGELIERPSVVKYLYNRQLTRSTIIEWQFGVCADWKVITPDVINSGKYKLAETCGLVRTKESSTYDYMHHRITIPIHDASGQMIGFAGRALPQTDGAKYFNPPDSPLYNKSKTLFGLHKAIKAFKTHGMAVLVEGYLDVIMLHQQGWNNAVASCGTALTEGQAKVLKRYTDTVLILRDGDNAGLSAIKKDIPILLSQQFNVLVCELPKGEDPDTLFRKPWERIIPILFNYHDGVQYLCDQWFKEAGDSISAKATAIEKTADLIANISNQVRRDAYINELAPKIKSQLKTQVTKVLSMRAAEREAEAQAKYDDEAEVLPLWVDRKRLEVDGFVQLAADTKGYKTGVHFSDGKSLFRVTNFTIKPLFHIFEQSNNRRLIEVDNGLRNSVVELPTTALVNNSNFEAELLNKGAFRCNEFFSRNHFKRITGWLLDNMPIAYELKTLGWQPEGFFAYANAVYHEGTLHQYDELGMIQVDDKRYMSLGNSKIHRDERQIDNPYENDLFLKYTPPREGMDFEKWAALFNASYADHAPFGISFAFLTLFKDIVTRFAKMPLLYCYGQKGSGKSSMAESILHLFFSGKDADGNLMRGFNMNPGQSTHFSFYNRVERFRNCPILFNEFDENTNEPWKTGTLKAGYDGEGREVGDGDSGKKRKTRMQKVQGTMIVVGQYLAAKDDAAVSSRSIPCNFSLERLKTITQQQIDAHNALKKEEQQGLCFLLSDLMKIRPEVQKRLGTNYGEVQAVLMKRLQQDNHRIEARLISNYSLILCATKTVLDLGIKLPYDYEMFFESAITRMIKHNQALKDTSIVGQFWKSVEVMFDKGLLQQGLQIAVQVFPSGIRLKEGDKVTNNPDVKGEVLLVRFDNVYAEYAKYHRERTGTAPQNDRTLLDYLKEQAYFIGLTPTVSFTDKRTSAYAFNYEAMKDMGIVLEKNHSQTDEQKPLHAKAKPEVSETTSNDDLPF